MKSKPQTPLNPNGPGEKLQSENPSHSFAPKPGAKLKVFKGSWNRATYGLDPVLANSCGHMTASQRRKAAEVHVRFATQLLESARLLENGVEAYGEGYYYSQSGVITGN